IIQRLLRSKNIKNSLWIIGEQIFQMLISLIVGILTARYLGPSNYGTLNYTASFVTFFTAIVTLGMEGVVIKKLIERPDEEGRYLGGCIALRFICSVLTIVILPVLIYVLNPSEPIKVVLVLLQSLQLAFKSVQILDSWFQRHLKSRFVSVGKMIACLIVSAYKVFLLMTSKDIIWFAFSNSLTDLVISILLYVFYSRESKQKLLPDISKGREVLAESYHFVISGLMVSIYSQMDKIMIGQMLSDTDVGLYTTAVTICGMWIFIPLAIINSYRPLILEHKKNGQEKLYLLRLKQLYSVIIWLCLGISFLIFIFSGFIIRILYGEAYIGSIGVLRTAIWFETFSVIGTARGIWILAENMNKYVKYYLMIGAGVNLILNLVMIPVMGITGAAIATLITQITTSIIAPLFFRETRVHSKIVFEAFTLKWLFGNREELQCLTDCAKKD
ncbi:MAG: flippase, partial [Clostridiales bacterium]|nr:flippase [Clostridiales bacterium]